MYYLFTIVLPLASVSLQDLNDVYTYISTPSGMFKGIEYD